MTDGRSKDFTTPPALSFATPEEVRQHLKEQHGVQASPQADHRVLDMLHVAKHPWYACTCGVLTGGIRDPRPDCRMHSREGW